MSTAHDSTHDSTHNNNNRSAAAAKALLGVALAVRPIGLIALVLGVLVGGDGLRNARRRG